VNESTGLETILPEIDFARRYYAAATGADVGDYHPPRSPAEQTALLAEAGLPSRYNEAERFHRHVDEPAAALLHVSFHDGFSHEGRTLLGQIELGTYLSADVYKDVPLPGGPWHLLAYDLAVSADPTWQPEPPYPMFGYGTTWGPAATLAIVAEIHRDIRERLVQTLPKP
jgi:hypothetical protein